MSNKAILIIMDGWGYGNKSKADAIFHSNTKYTDSLYNNTQVGQAFLKTDGEAVGLPNGQMGNSEVGHLNIGAGRVVYQDLVKINKAIDDKSFFSNAEIVKAFDYAKAQDKKVHFIGLVSDGGVHSSTAHLVALCQMAEQMQLSQVYVHALTDGRDTDPKSGLAYMQQLQKDIEGTAAQVASVCGRYYGMDRDKRWDRIRKYYELITQGRGEAFASAQAAIQAAYDAGITDEFINASVIQGADAKPLATIAEDDVVICFNFRTDRLREITTVLSQTDMPEEGMHTLPLYYLTMTKYDASFRGVHVAFDKEFLHNTLGEVVSRANKTQLRIAETEKYAHVTFFFSGGREASFEGEHRILIPSPKVATYDLKPSMSAHEVTQAVLKDMKEQAPDLIILNFANSDMVGHTGVYAAIQEAVETVDGCVEQVSRLAQDLGYSVLITADHGNSDNALNPDGSPNTAHSLNLVPVFLLDKECHSLQNGALCDLAPTMLALMGIEQPKEMTGKSLLVKR